MTLSKFNQKLDKELGRKLSGLDFRRSGALIYKKKHSEDLFHELTFPNRYDRTKNTCFFNAHICISFFEIEKLLRPSFIEESETIATVVMPIHLLREDRIYKEWSLSHESELPAVVSNLMNDLEEYAFPFLEKYSNVDNIENQLKSDAPKDWFILNPEQRIATLAAIAFIKGSKGESLSLLDDAIRQREGALPKKLSLLKEVRKNILAT